MDRAWALEQVTAATPEYATTEQMSPRRLISEIEDELGIPVTLTSHGFSYSDVSEPARV
jgi:hypothetical protein